MKATHHRLSKMVEHDLKEIAKGLPNTGQNHAENLIWWYNHKQWVGVSAYLDSIALLEPTQETFLSKCSKWLDRKVNWLTGLLNRLD